MRGQVNDTKIEHLLSKFVMTLRATYREFWSRLVSRSAASGFVIPTVDLLCLPRERSVLRWLKRFTHQTLEALMELNSEIVCETILKQRLR
jgi:hypothetical protein